MSDNAPIGDRWTHYADIELAIGGEIWIDARDSTGTLKRHFMH